MTMRVLVIGAGAVGGWLAGVLARGGAEVALLARGATLRALRERGLVLARASGASGSPCRPPTAPRTCRSPTPSSWP